MRTKFWIAGLFLLIFTGSAHADLGFWSANLVGKWQHPQNGDTYDFRSDATYTFHAGRAKRRVGNLSHSGYWKIVQPTEKESGGSMEGPVALLLKSRKRTVLEGKKPRVLKSNRQFRVVVDTIESDERMVNKNRYFIDGAKWKRVK